MLAGQDFRHTCVTQGATETVANIICRLDCILQVTYSNDKMSSETREVIPYGKLQEGLTLELMKRPGAMSYNELCMSAKNDKQRQTELKWLNYHNSLSSVPPAKKQDGKVGHKPVVDCSSHRAKAPAVEV